jgi:hypothetical protein
MPYAQIWSTASNASTTGGTFADSLTIQSTDQLSVANYGAALYPGTTYGARIIEAIAIDSAHTAELEVMYTRPESTHDQLHGWRSQIQAAAFNTVGHVKAVDILTGRQFIPLYRSDTPTLNVTSTASDVVLYSWLTEYLDFPGAYASLVTPSVVDAGFKSRVGINVNAETSTSTAGAYGTARAFNADDPRLHANTWYAIVGINVGAPVYAATLTGPDWGGQRLGVPTGSFSANEPSWFYDQSLKWGTSGSPVPMVPVFNSNNAPSTYVQLIDASTSLTPGIDLQMVELNYPPTWSPQSAATG